MSTPNDPGNSETLSQQDGGKDSSVGQMDQGTYQVLRQRLSDQAEVLQSRLEELNEQRRQVFGSIPTELISTWRITTEHNCVARDLFAIGDHLLFGYNVQM